MRTVLVFALLVFTTACTFPDVDYTDGGAGATGSSSTSSSSATCSVLSACATDAMNCADLADNKHKGCINPCKTDAICLADCDAALHSELVTCAAACGSCAAPSCGSTPTNCESLVGL